LSCSLPGKQGAPAHGKGARRLAQDVGNATDLFVLGREVEARAAVLPDAAGLARRIRRVSEDAARQLLAQGEELLAEPPRRFADRVLAERG
jgi:hypothetical protein